MATYKVEIPMKLPSLNEYIRACGVWKGKWNKGNQMKKDCQNEMSYFFNKLPVFEKPIEIHFIWVEANKKRDYDNIAFAKKFILDALQKCGKLKNDNRKYVTNFHDSFELGQETKIILYIEEVGDVKERIISYMKEFGSITTFEAFTDLGCTRLSEYIRQIRQTHIVKDEWLTATNRYGEKRRYKRFWLAD